MVNTNNSNEPKIEPTTDAKWTWNSEVTQYNRKGAQLEDHDLLGRYNTAIYGYQETLPIATVNNSRLRLCAFDGFEDYGYKDDPCEPYCKPAKVHFKTGVTLNKLAPAESHTGNYSLKVEGDPLTIEIPVSAANESSVPVVTVDVTKTTCNDTVVNLKGTGLLGRYYKNANTLGNSQTWTGFVLQRETPQVFFGWNRGGAPWGNYEWPLWERNDVSAKFTGKFQVTKGGTYQLFFWEVLDGAIIKITEMVNGSPVETVVAGDCTNNSSCTYRDYSIGYSFKAGVLYGIEVQFLQGKGGRGRLDVTWKAPCSNSFERIPPENWYPEGKEYLANNTVTYGGGSCYSPQQIQVTQNAIIDAFELVPNTKMTAGVWVKKGGQDCKCNNYTGMALRIKNGEAELETFKPVSRIIEGWQLFEVTFTVPENTNQLKFEAAPDAGTTFYLDDLRFHPFNANMKSFVFDPQTLRLASELDENNYASFYEYDDEGTLVRVKKETKEGIKTIKETRSAVQGAIKKMD